MHIINILLMLMTKILILKKVEKKEIFKNLKKKVYMLTLKYLTI